MKEQKSYSVRVQLIRPQQTGYQRLRRGMCRSGFRQSFKNGNGGWVFLPRDDFIIRTDETVDVVARRATKVATEIDPAAIVKAAEIRRRW